MRWKLLHAEQPKTYALIFQEGDEVKGQLQQFVKQQAITAAQLTAIGAFSDVTVQYFDWDSKQYQIIPPIREQVEVLNLTGDVAEKDGEPTVHVHVVVGKRDGTAHGGDLKEAHVRPTLELILTTSPAYLRKKHDEKTGLALIDPSA